MKTKRVTIDPRRIAWEPIAEAAKIIREGGLVIFPTETVYGLGANFNDPKAMEALAQVKKRPADKPFSVLVGGKDAVSSFARNLSLASYKVIDAFWPGPLTVVVPAGGGKTIGLRMPDHAVALELIQRAQCPLAAPSANEDGQVPPITCNDALKYFDGRVALAIDAGAAKIGISSTVADMTQNFPKVLREGPITAKAIEAEAFKKHILFVCTGNSCRSVMAEHLLKKAVQKSGRKDIEVLSGGTSVLLSGGATPETIEILAKEGLDVSRHASRSVTSMMLRKADLIFPMTAMHRQQILMFEPSVASRTYLLREFAKTGQSEYDLGVPDPIGQGADTYEECATIIKEAVNKIMELI